MKVLIADDSEIIQERLVNLITSIGGVSVLGPCSNTLEAKSLLDNENPDLIISDIRMPGGGGFELVKFVKDSELNIPIIIYSNYNYSTYLQMAEHYGVEYFFNKATDAQKLLDTIKALKNNGSKTIA